MFIGDTSVFPFKKKECFGLSLVQRGGWLWQADAFCTVLL